MAKLAVLLVAIFTFQSAFAWAVDTNDNHNHNHESDLVKLIRKIKDVTYEHPKTFENLIIRDAEEYRTLLTYIREMVQNVDEIIEMFEVEAKEFKNMHPFVNELREIQSVFKQAVNYDIVSNYEQIKYHFNTYIYNLCEFFQKFIPTETYFEETYPEVVVTFKNLLKTYVETLKIVEKRYGYKYETEYFKYGETGKELASQLQRALNHLVESIKSPAFDKFYEREYFVPRIMEYIESMKSIVQKVEQIQYPTTIEFETKYFMNLKKMIENFEQISKEIRPTVPVTAFKNQFIFFVERFGQEFYQFIFGIQYPMEKTTTIPTEMKNIIIEFLIATRRMYKEFDVSYMQPQEQFPVFFRKQMQFYVQRILEIVNYPGFNAKEYRQVLTFQCREFAQRLEFIYNQLQEETVYKTTYGVETQVAMNLKEIVMTLRRLYGMEVFTDFEQFKMEFISCIEKATYEMEKLFMTGNYYQFTIKYYPVFYQFLNTLKYVFYQLNMVRGGEYFNEYMRQYPEYYQEFEKYPFFNKYAQQYGYPTYGPEYYQSGKYNTYVSEKYNPFYNYMKYNYGKLDQEYTPVTKYSPVYGYDKYNQLYGQEKYSKDYKYENYSPKYNYQQYIYGLFPEYNKYEKYTPEQYSKNYKYEQYNPLYNQYSYGKMFPEYNKYEKYTPEQYSKDYKYEQYNPLYNQYTYGKMFPEYNKYEKYTPEQYTKNYKYEQYNPMYNQYTYGKMFPEYNKFEKYTPEQYSKNYKYEQYNPLYNQYSYGKVFPEYNKLEKYTPEKYSKDYKYEQYNPMYNQYTFGKMFPEYNKLEKITPEKYNKDYKYEQYSPMYNQYTFGKMFPEYNKFEKYSKDYKYEQYNPMYNQYTFGKMFPEYNKLEKITPEKYNKDYKYEQYSPMYNQYTFGKMFPEYNKFEKYTPEKYSKDYKYEQYNPMYNQYTFGKMFPEYNKLEKYTPEKYSKDYKYEQYTPMYNQYSYGKMFPEYNKLEKYTPVYGLGPFTKDYKYSYNYSPFYAYGPEYYQYTKSFDSLYNQLLGRFNPVYGYNKYYAEKY